MPESVFYLSTPQKPTMGLVGPVWWHKHGMKMKAYDFQRYHKRLVLKASAARLTLEPSVLIKGLWSVRWVVAYYVPTCEQTEGSITFDDIELMSAFGLHDYVWHTSEWMLDRFGGSSAKQGKFIRWERFLNIPGPGTGHDGDANISIELDKEIKTAIQQMLEN